VEQRLRPTDPLCPISVAKSIGVIVVDLKDIPGVNDECVRQLTVIDPSAWSAATLIHNDKKLIIFNGSHTVGRRSNSIMHELSHLICEHKAANVEMLASGMMLVKAYDNEQEQEADLLSAALLLPRVALVSIMTSGLTLEEAAQRYRVSEDLLKMRLQITGVYLQFKRRRA